MVKSSNIYKITTKINLIWACLEHLEQDKLSEVAGDVLSRAEREMGIGIPLETTYKTLETGLKAIIDLYGYSNAVETLKQVKALKG